MKEIDENKDKRNDELFLVPRRWDELSLIEKAKIQREQDDFPGAAENDRAFLERMRTLSRQHYLGSDK